MEQTPAPKRSNRPVIALLFSGSALFLMCISFAVNNPNGFDAYIENNPLWYVAQALLCLTMILSLVGSVLGVMALRADGGNRGLGIASLVVGIPILIFAVLVFGYVMVFIGVITVFSP